MFRCYVEDLSKCDYIITKKQMLSSEVLCKLHFQWLMFCLVSVLIIDIQ